MDTPSAKGGKKDGFKVINKIFQRPARGSSADGAVNTCSLPSYEPAELLSSTEHSEWLSGEFYINILIREGRNLAATDVDSTDPFVRVTFGHESASPLEDSTRVCYHNSDPFWEESLVFPLQSKTPDTRVRLAVYGRNDVKKPKFMGHVVFELGFILSSIRQINEEVVHWCPLVAQKSKQNVSGELCFAISVIDPAQYIQLHNDMSNLLDAASLHQRLGGMMLQMELHDIRRLQASSERMGPLSLEVRIGRSLVKKAVVCQDVVDANGTKTSVSTLGGVIHIPLAKAFRKGLGMGQAEERPSFSRRCQGMVNRMAQDVVVGATIIGKPLKPNKEKNEIADIKIYLKAGSQIIAKTQIPIWTVPTKVEEAPALLSMPSSAGTTPTQVSASQSSRDFAKVSEPMVTSPRAGALEHASSCKNGGTQGREFVRTMQNYRRDLIAPYIRLELVVAFELRPKGAHVTAVETVEESDPEEEDIITSPTPMIPPADLDVFVADAVLDCGPNKLFSLLWKQDSEVVRKISEMEKLKDVVVSPFTTDPVTKTRSRRTTYVKALGVNIPFVPKEAGCSVLMTVQAKQDDGWCVTEKVETKAPQGDAFYVLMQWVAVQQSATKTRLKVTLHVEFTRNVMTKGYITSQSITNSRKAAELVISLVREQLGGGSPSPGLSQAPSLAASALPSPSPADAAGGLWSQVTTQGPLSLAQLLELAALLLVVLALWHLAHTVARSADKAFFAMRDLAEAMRAHHAANARDVHPAASLREVMREIMAHAAACPDPPGSPPPHA